MPAIVRRWLQARRDRAAYEAHDAEQHSRWLKRLADDPHLPRRRDY